MGKSTLLIHIAKRILKIPSNIDVFLCEQDIILDDVTAVEMVIRADQNRLSLLKKVIFIFFVLF